MDSFNTVERYSLPSNNRYHEEFLDRIPFCQSSRILDDSLSIQSPPRIFISAKIAAQPGPTMVMSLNHKFKLRKASSKWRSDPRYAMMTAIWFSEEGCIIQKQEINNRSKGWAQGYQDDASAHPSSLAFLILKWAGFQPCRACLSIIVKRSLIKKFRLTIGLIGPIKHVVWNMTISQSC